MASSHLLKTKAECISLLLHAVQAPAELFNGRENLPSIQLFEGLQLPHSFYESSHRVANDFELLGGTAYVLLSNRS